MKLQAVDIKNKKQFKRAGYNYQLVEDFGNNWYLYEMIRYMDSPIKAYELVKAKRFKQPDGEVIYIYPSSEDWGTYGWTITGTEGRCRKRIKELLELKNGENSI